MTLTKRIALPILGLVLVAGMAGCSSGGGAEDASDGGTANTTSDDTTDTTTDTTADPEASDSSGDAASEEFCANLSDVGTFLEDGPGAQEARAAFVALFPEDLRDDAQTYVDEGVAWTASYDEATRSFSGEPPNPSEEFQAYLASCGAGAGAG